MSGWQGSSPSPSSNWNAFGPTGAIPGYHASSSPSAAAPHSPHPAVQAPSTFQWSNPPHVVIAQPAPMVSSVSMDGMSFPPPPQYPPHHPHPHPHPHAHQPQPSPPHPQLQPKSIFIHGFPPPPNNHYHHNHNDHQQPTHLHPNHSTASPAGVSLIDLSPRTPPSTAAASSASSSHSVASTDSSASSFSSLPYPPSQEYPSASTSFSFFPPPPSSSSPSSLSYPESPRRASLSHHQATNADNHLRPPASNHVTHLARTQSDLGPSSIGVTSASSSPVTYDALSASISSSPSASASSSSNPVLSSSSLSSAPAYPTRAISFPPPPHSSHSNPIARSPSPSTPQRAPSPLANTGPSYPTSFNPSSSSSSTPTSASISSSSSSPSSSSSSPAAQSVATRSNSAVFPLARSLTPPHLQSSTSSIRIPNGAPTTKSPAAISAPPRGIVLVPVLPVHQPQLQLHPQLQSQPQVLHPSQLQPIHHSHIYPSLLSPSPSSTGQQLAGLIVQNPATTFPAAGGSPKQGTRRFSSLMANGLALERAAEESEQRGDKEAALSLYINSIDCLFATEKEPEDTETKQMLKTKLPRLIAKVEQLLAEQSLQLQARAQAAAAAPNVQNTQPLPPAATSSTPSATAQHQLQPPTTQSSYPTVPYSQPAISAIPAAPNGDYSQDSASTKDDKIECPVCGSPYPKEEIEKHTLECLDKQARASSNGSSDKQQPSSSSATSLSSSLIGYRPFGGLFASTLGQLGNLPGAIGSLPGAIGIGNLPLFGSDTKNKDRAPVRDGRYRSLSSEDDHNGKEEADASTDSASNSEQQQAAEGDQAAPAETISYAAAMFYRHSQMIDPSVAAKIVDGKAGGTEQGGAKQEQASNESNEVVTTLLVGIKNATVSVASLVKGPVTEDDCKFYRKVPLDEDSGTEFVGRDFVEHAPLAFHGLRQFYGISGEDYMHSIGVDKSEGLSSVVSPGKSGSNFYFSVDNRYVMKTINDDEFWYFKDRIHAYYQHMTENPNSLLVRIMALYTVRVRVPSFHFVVMENLYPLHLPIHETYDLKGSSAGRRTIVDDERVSGEGTGIVMKDVDFLRRRKIILGPEKRKVFFDQLAKDSLYLSSNGYMDYSLLLLVHKTKPRDGGKEKEVPPSSLYPDLERIFQQSRPSAIARPSVFRADKGGFASTSEFAETLDEVYFMAIIDILQPYNWRKKLENTYKKLFENEDAISCVDPIKYRIRFEAFLQFNTQGIIPFE